MDRRGRHVTPKVVLFLLHEAYMSPGARADTTRHVLRDGNAFVSTGRHLCGSLMSVDTR